MKRLQKFRLAPGKFSLLVGGEPSENEILEIDPGRMAGADADPEANEAGADMPDQALDPVVSAGASAHRDLDAAEFDIDLVVDDDQRRFRVDPEITANRPGGAPALVDVRLRFDQINPAAVTDEGSCFGLKFAPGAPRAVVDARKGIDEAKPDIVSRPVVFLAGIPEAGDNERR